MILDVVPSDQDPYLPGVLDRWPPVRPAGAGRLDNHIYHVGKGLAGWSGLSQGISLETLFDSDVGELGGGVSHDFRHDAEKDGDCCCR